MCLDVELFLWGKDLMPDVVTTMLGISPDKFHRRGDEEIGPNQKITAFKEGMWAYSTNRDVASSEVKDHLIYLEKVLGNNIRALFSSGILEKARIYISVLVAHKEEEYGKWEEELDADLIALVSKMRTSLYFTVMFASRDPLP